ncbi:MAG: aldehyde dehydrogenase family protein, partial [Fusobacteriaceae bacterium]
MENFKKLREIVINNKKEILKALYLDLGKSEEEALLTEYMPVMKELDLFIKKSYGWRKPKRVWSKFSLLGCRSYIERVPYGEVLIISPWNYPFQLALLPLIGALGGGNSVTLKPSELSSHTENVLLKIIQELSLPEVKIEVGDYRVAEKLLKQRFDYIFFTGSTAVGKIVYRFASENLTPVTLELGGKSPVIIEPDADLNESVEKIMWGKFLNCGQTCVAPDYVYLPNDKIDDFVRLSKEYEMKYPNKTGKIISEKHHTRLREMTKEFLTLSQEDIDNLKFPFLLVIDPKSDSPLLSEEIFGPILPILGYDPNSLQKIYEDIKKKPRPLALYIFRKNSKDLNTHGVDSGTLCINGTVLQVADPSLPFGGIGASGMGNYHGKYSFDTFTHEKSILEMSNLK